MQRALVTGGTGFIGSNLARALLERGWNVRILRRPNSDLRAIGKAAVEHVIGDVTDGDSLEQAMRGCDTVFHTAAIVSYWKRERKRMYEVNIGGTQNVVEACRAAGVAKLVHTSSIAAVGPTPPGVLADESTPFLWEAYDVGYRISKYRAELEVRKGIERGLFAVMVSPSVVIGPGDIHFHGGQLIRDVYKKRIFYYPEGGLNIVYVDDVVRAEIAAAERGESGERYLATGTNLTHREALEVIAEVVGGIMPFIKLPAALARGIAGTAEMVAAITGTRPWVTRELIAGIGMNSWFSSDKAIRELGYTVTPFREAVSKTFDWYRRNDLL